MILLVMGLPGRCADWCAGVLLRLAGRTGQTADIASPALEAMLGYQPVPSVLEAVGSLLLANRADHIVVTVRQPDQALFEVLSGREIAFLIALEEPAAAAADLIAATAVTPQRAVRALANCYPQLLPFHALPAAMPLTAARIAADPAAAVAAIGAHCDLAVTRRRAAAIAGEMAAQGRSLAPPRDAELPPHAAKMLEGALAPYHRYFLAGSLDEIVWTRDLFLFDSGDSPHGAIDVAGGPRNLIFGPYIQLPPGAWTARVVLGLSPETPGTIFLVDAFADSRQLGHAVLAPSRGGVHVAEIHFTVERPSRQGLEIRVMVASHGSRGRLAFGHVVLQQRASSLAAAIDNTDDFETVLAL